MDAAKNFAKVEVSQGYDADDTSIVLQTGHGARLPAAPFNAVYWNATDYPDPSDDPNVEIVRVTARTDDTLTVTRAQESTAGSTKNTAGKTYLMTAGPTAKLITDIQEAINSGDLWTQLGSAEKTSSATGSLLNVTSIDSSYDFFKVIVHIKSGANGVYPLVLLNNASDTNIINQYLQGSNVSASANKFITENDIVLLGDGSVVDTGDVLIAELTIMKVRTGTSTISDRIVWTNLYTFYDSSGVVLKTGQTSGISEVQAKISQIEILDGANTTNGLAAGSAAAIDGRAI